MNWLNNLLNWIQKNRRQIAVAIEVIKDVKEKIKEEKDEPVIPEPDKPDVPIDEPDKPDVPIKLLTENKIFIWSECSTPRLPKAKKGKKYVDIFNAKDLIVTNHDPRRKAYVNQKEAIQKAGGKVYLCVHPWYSPWKGRSIEQMAELTKTYANVYDGVVIDLEGVLIKKLSETMKHFSGIKNLWVAPKMDKKYLDDSEGFTGYYNIIKNWQVNYLWWNYSLTEKQWKWYFKNYKFPDSSKHNLLLSFEKYLHVVPLDEIEIIIDKSPLRIGSFNPKTKGFINLSKLKNKLIKNK